MKDYLTGCCGVILNVLSISIEQVESWLSIISLVVITATTVGIQVYRMIRDRNIDKQNKESTYVDSQKNKESED